MKRQILKLNSNYFPIGLGFWQDILIGMFNENMHGVDIHFAKDDEGKYDKLKIEYWQVIKTIEKWKKLPIRPCDEYVITPSSILRLPPIVICAKYSKIRYPRVRFPTRRNIWIRDNYTCGYTGKKLAKKDLSVDHIIPISRGGQDTWTNMITCDRRLNSCKSDKTPEEIGLKLQFKPIKPKNGLVFDIVYDEWFYFIGGYNKNNVD